MSFLVKSYGVRAKLGAVEETTRLAFCCLPYLWYAPKLRTILPVVIVYGRIGHHSVGWRALSAAVGDLAKPIPITMIGANFDSAKRTVTEWTSEVLYST